MYDTVSPIRYLPKVTMPTLIVQPEEDARTRMTDAEPWLLVDRLGRLRQWFAYWLQDVKPVDPAPVRANTTGMR